jgi:hypothetical protein
MKNFSKLSFQPALLWRCRQSFINARIPSCEGKACGLCSSAPILCIRIPVEGGQPVSAKNKMKVGMMRKMKFTRGYSTGTWNERRQDEIGCYIGEWYYLHKCFADAIETGGNERDLDTNSRDISWSSSPPITSFQSLTFRLEHNIQ